MSTRSNWWGLGRTAPGQKAGRPLPPLRPPPPPPHSACRAARRSPSIPSSGITWGRVWIPPGLPPKTTGPGFGGYKSTKYPGHLVGGRESAVPSQRCRDLVAVLDQWARPVNEKRLSMADAVCRRRRVAFGMLVATQHSQGCQTRASHTLLRLVILPTVQFIPLPGFSKLRQVSSGQRIVSV